MAQRTLRGVQVVVAPGIDGAGVLLAVGAEPVPVADLADAVAEKERAVSPRWVFASVEQGYGVLLRAGVRVGRAHDLGLTAALLDVRAGRARSPRRLTDERPALFGPDLVPNPDVTDLAERLSAQQQEVGGDRALRLLVAAESAGALAAAEMGHDGLPFSAAAHRALLARELGPRPGPGADPVRLVELTDAICAAFGIAVNPDSAAEVLGAFARLGITVDNTQARTLREVAHPAAALLLRHKELARLHGTFGWAWLDTWVRDGRFRALYSPGGTPSGRWASRGGGALQIPRALRTSVIAEEGHTFVVADAGQLEPRVLAAMSGDPAMVAAAGTADLYGPLAERLGDRHRAKVAVLGVLYGATAGQARSLLGELRRQYPVAVEMVEAAARAGERGEVVHSWLGRASPGAPDGDWDPGARGRFTRNFVVQATAAEWALCLLAQLRRQLAAELPDARLVFFQHDEVVVHCRTDDAPQVVAAVHAAAQSARVLVFGDTAVQLPMEVSVRPVYGTEAEAATE